MIFFKTDPLASDFRPPSSWTIFLPFLLILFLSFPIDHALANIPNQLYRIGIKKHADFTRITISVATPPEYTISEIPGNRLRIVLHDTNGTLYKKFKSYSDVNIGGLVVKRRGDSILVTFQLSTKAGWRDLTRTEISAVTLDIGSQFKPAAPRPSLGGREKIWAGVEKLVRDFDPPLKSEIPFLPTDRGVLKKLLSEEEMNLFSDAEGALYKGRLIEAEEIFARFASKESSVRALALYRLAETWYKLQKYPQALAAFRDAEKIWPAFLGYNPEVTFYYGDCIARSGDLKQARILLAGLLARLADKSYAPSLLVRLGDILARQGHEAEAQAIYRNVAENFKKNKASQMALIRFADSRFLSLTPWNYLPVSDIYLTASRQSGDLDMREEAHFKHVLLESIHGEADESLQKVMQFQKKFPRGVYAAVTRNIREVLVAEVYRLTRWEKKSAPLVRFMEEQHEYLADTVGQPGFLATVARGYNESGRPIELVKLLTAMVERSWAVPLAQEMYASIVENAELIGDSATAEKYARACIAKYPASPGTRYMKERLGSVYFNRDKYAESRDSLAWLLKKGERAVRPDSYYLLGRSLWELKSYAQAAKAMDLFLADSAGRNPAFVPDAYFVAASSRSLLGDTKNALKLFEASLKLSDNKRHEEFMYKAGQINMQSGNPARAKAIFNELVKSGKDPDWQKLAQQALLSIR